MMIPFSTAAMAMALCSLVGVAVRVHQASVIVISEIRLQRIRRFAAVDSEVRELAAEILPVLERARDRKGSNRMALAKAASATVAWAAHLWYVVEDFLWKR